MRNVQRQRRTKISVSRIVRPIAASCKMTETEEEANTLTNAPPPAIQRCPTQRREALTNSMMKLVNASVSKLGSGDPPTIYKVPQRIRQGNDAAYHIVSIGPYHNSANKSLQGMEEYKWLNVNEAAYEPQIVSIGPYHNGANKSLHGMEEHKWLYLRSFLSRNPKHPLEDYLKAMEELEDEARSCYSDNTSPQVDEFVKMMVLDACFIVEFFLRFTDPFNDILKKLKQKEELEQKENELEQNEDLGSLSAMEFFLYSADFEDPISRTIDIASLIGYDMLLLENQIPFFVLQRIFIMACPVNVPHLLAEMALDFFDRFMPRNKDIQIKKIENNASCPYYHLLHLFHSHLLPTPTYSKEEPNLSCNPEIKPNLSCSLKIKSVLNKLMKPLIIFLPCLDKAPLPITKRRMIPCVADLELVGVKFKKNEESNSILDVKFSDGGVLEIPQLFIVDYTNTLLRNLIALEQFCYPRVKLYFTNYVCFMDCLVNTSKDVALLHCNGIIDHLLGSDDDVASLFNHLCFGIANDLEEKFLWDVKEKVQKHCENKWNMWWASLKRDYFTNPWSVISLIAALILLLLTITQTFFSVFPYYQPRS